MNEESRKTDPQADNGSESEAQKPSSSADATRESEATGSPLAEAARKGTDILKAGVGKISELASRSAEMASLKLEMRRLRHNLEDLCRSTGRKIWQLHQSGELEPEKINTHCREEIQRYQDLQKELARKEEELRALGLSEE